MFFTSACSNNQITGNTTSEASFEKPIVNVDKLEIFHFHGDVQCYSCKVLGDYASETINTYFKEELESGIIVFEHVNGQLPENRELVLKYGATGSSLWFGVYDDGNFNAEENINVWYKLRNKQDYMNYLRGVINEKLEGI